MMAYLDRRIPEPRIELHSSNPLELLVATILSAQCTDTRVNRVTPALFKKYPRAEDYAKADPGELEAMVRSTGFFRMKARNLIACGQALVERHGGKVPDRMEDLIRLPGVWRKTANVILGACFGKPAIVVDTHVRRVAQRWALTRSDDADRIEQDLAGLIPRKAWARVSQQMLLYGRYFCTARNPECDRCGAAAFLGRPARRVPGRGGRVEPEASNRNDPKASNKIDRASKSRVT